MPRRISAKITFLAVCFWLATFSSGLLTPANKGEKSVSLTEKRLLKQSGTISRSSFLLSFAALTVCTQLPTPTSARTSTDNGSFIAENTNNNAREKAKPLDATQESFSGLVAGSTLSLTKTLFKYPLDTVTVRLQMPPPSDYSIMRPVELFEGSYRGLVNPLLANIPGGAVFFAVKDYVTSILSTQQPEIPPLLRTSIAVAVAQIPYWLVRNPSEVVKTRQQANIDGFGEGVSALDAYRKVLDDSMQTSDSDNPGLTRGLEGFYIGYWENILYAYPADVIKFICYDVLTNGRKDLPPTEGAVAGAASTAIAQFITTPLDVVRNRIMAQQEDKQLSESSTSKYMEQLIQLGKDEGLPGLFAGASPRVGKALLSGAIQFATYEDTKQKISRIFAKSASATVGTSQ